MWVSGYAVTMISSLQSDWAVQAGDLVRFEATFAASAWLAIA